MHHSKVCNTVFLELSSPTERIHSLGPFYPRNSLYYYQISDISSDIEDVEEADDSFVIDQSPCIVVKSGTL